MLAPKRQELPPKNSTSFPKGGSGPVDDGTAESTSPANKTMFPSSFGMTFCVRPDSKELQINARWGHYHRDRSKTLTNRAATRRWSGSGARGRLRADHTQGRTNQLDPDAEFPQVQVQGLVRSGTTSRASRCSWSTGMLSRRGSGIRRGSSSLN